jgi:hypothetical protein
MLPILQLNPLYLDYLIKNNIVYQLSLIGGWRRAQHALPPPPLMLSSGLCPLFKHHAHQVDPHCAYNT